MSGPPSSITAEGLGGVNISGVEDPNVQGDPPSGNRPRASDPDWVDRKDPDTLPKSTPGLGEGVVFDPGSMTVTSMGGGAAEGSGGSASTSPTWTQEHELGGKGNPEAFGVRGTDTQAGPGVTPGKGAVQRERV